MSETLLALLRDEIAADTRIPVGAPVQALANAISACSNDGGGVTAILYYGSGLWKQQDQHSTADTIHDFYAVVERFRAFDPRRLTAWLGTILPPNVYYLETPHAGATLRAKVAVLTRAQFRRMARGRTPTPQIWARFAQPCRLIYARDRAAGDEIIDDLVQAVLAFHAHALPLAGRNADAETVWRRGLADTYAAELRPEQRERSQALFAANAAAFTRRTQLARAVLKAKPHRPPVFLPIPLLKALALLRLMKATVTFSGGVDYILWKIARQSGVRLTATERQKRYPLLFAWPLLWQLYRRGGFR